MDKDLVYRFINTFLGYGNLDSKFWFIGLEESSDGVNVEELLKLWCKNSCSNIIDIKTLHKGNPFLNDKPPIQTTWSKLMRILKSFENCNWQGNAGNNKVKSKYMQNKEVRFLQGSEWGTSEGKCLLLELFPLPNKQAKKLNEDYTITYHFWTKRKEYENEIMGLRVDMLKKLISNHTNKIIIDYSGRNIFSLDKKEIIYTKDSCLFLRIPHPCSHGFTNEQAHELGVNLQKAITES